MALAFTAAIAGNVVQHFRVAGGELVDLLNDGHGSNGFKTDRREGRQWAGWSGKDRRRRGPGGCLRNGLRTVSSHGDGQRRDKKNQSARNQLAKHTKPSYSIEFARAAWLSDCSVSTDKATVAIHASFWAE